MLIHLKVLWCTKHSKTLSLVFVVIISQINMLSIYLM